MLMRIFLLLAAACIFLEWLALLCLMQAASMAGNIWSEPFTWCTFPLILYLLAAFVMNFPRFPLAWHAKAFRYVQILLLPLLVFIFRAQALFLPLLFVYGMYFCFWRNSLEKRLEESPFPVIGREKLQKWGSGDNL